ncbi:hypothetical protein C8R47DRAFT_1006970 [Mycena vitilis]|nr:hypothetical protein C8R47DRAFT_1006970 [Mycena vitilis]
MPKADVPEPRVKRQRKESAGLENLTRSDIWRDDGNVVFQVESTQFRVHWSVLTIHSAYFAAIRALPTPANHLTIESCPVITLHDSAVDIEHLLDALYNPHLLAAEKFSFPFIAAIVRLGRKYDFKEILALAIQRLVHENPMTLQSYEPLTQIVDNAFSYSPTRIVSRAGLNFDTITLARENELFALLPCAYLRAILFYTQEEIFDGIPLRIGPRVTLFPEDQRICVLGSKNLLHAQWSYAPFAAYMSSNKPTVGCSSRAGCIKTMKTMRLELSRTGRCDAPFRLAAKQNFCHPCETHHQAVMAETRKKLWEDLPGFFYLPDWGELRNEL